MIGRKPAREHPGVIYHNSEEDRFEVHDQLQMPPPAQWKEAETENFDELERELAAEVERQLAVNGRCCPFQSLSLLFLHNFVNFL